MVARCLDVLVIAAATSSPALFHRLDKEGQSYALVDRSFTALSAHFVGRDDKAAVAMATQHLIEPSYTRIAHIRGRKRSRLPKSPLRHHRDHRREALRHGVPKT